MLEMRPVCERCEAPLAHDAAAMQHRCPNCAAAG
jgi:predicted RNA-binding Zn-ribbon protein involved in translation (DUF1610 family)